MTRYASHFLILGTALLALGACEVQHKIQDDAMYYTDRTIGQFRKIEEFGRSRFDKNYHPKVDELPLHLSNFDTFICDGARQIVANFNPEETAVSVQFDGRNKYLLRDNPLYPFGDGIYNLFIMQDGTLLLDKDGATRFQHCRPLVPDSMKQRLYTNAAGAVKPTYNYTPTIPPVEYYSAEPRFEKEMQK